MVTTPAINPDAAFTSLLALLVADVVEDAEGAATVDVAVTLVQLDAVPAGTVALADSVKSAHCHVRSISHDVHSIRMTRPPTW